MVFVTDHDPKIMHASGNVVDLGPRNCCSSIRFKDTTQGLSSKRRFVLSYVKPFAIPDPLVESKFFEENIITNYGLPHRETPRKTGPVTLISSLADILDVDVAGTMDSTSY